MLDVAILGGSGYTGFELLRLLGGHPHVRVTAVTSERSAGLPVSDAFPGYRNQGLKFEPLHLKTLLKKAELFFLCLPHKTSQKSVASLHRDGKTVIDLSADYRLKSAAVYKKWYNTPHHYSSLLKKAVYGLPELYRDEIRNASIIANPGCYPVSALLGLSPVIGKDFIHGSSIVIDSKSGTSGAGRSPAQPFMFCEVNESVKVYAVTVHRHTPEIRQELERISGKKISVIFTPHLMPMDRGILSTIYVRLKKNVPLRVLQKLYRDYYRDEPFVRVLDNGVCPSTKAVRGTNFCDISVFTHTGQEHTLLVVTAIDNLIKGAAGSAVQNMNILYGFDETAGLLSSPYFP